MRKPYVFLLKNIALISSSRAYYVALHFITLYLVSFYLLNITSSKILKLLDSNIHLIIFSSSFTIASGFLINNFYDIEKDRLAKPLRISINNLISINSRLTVYLIFNFIALLLAFISTYKIFFLIFFYQLLIWLYSHKLKKILLLNNLLYTLLIFYPYLLMIFYFKEYSIFLIINGFLWFLLIFLSDVIKDFKTAQLDIIYKQNTIPIYFKEPKKILSILLLLVLLFLIYLDCNFFFGRLFYFYYGFGIILLAATLFFTFLFFNHKKISWFGLLFKFYVFVGVLSIPLQNFLEYISALIFF